MRSRESKTVGLPASMRRAGLGVGVALTLGGGGAGVGCKAIDKARARQRCDQDQLAALATKLDDSKPDARVMIVSEGLLEACPELYPKLDRILTLIAKPDGYHSLYDNEEEAFRATLERICPAHAQLGEIIERAAPSERAAAVVELCGFSRYKLFTTAELRELGGAGLFVWVAHEFLLESGTPPKVAKIISRALFRVHEVLFEFPLIFPPRDQELLVLPAAAPLRDGPTIYISRRELIFNEEQLTTLDQGRLNPDVVQGHVIRPLFEKLEEETNKADLVRSARGEIDAERVAVLVVDAGVTFASVVDTMYTAGRLEYAHHDFVVESIYPVRRALRIDPPRFVVIGDTPAPEDERPLALRVFILEDGYRVSWNQGESKILAKLDPESRKPEAYDRQGLAKLVQELTQTNPRLGWGILSAENSITMDVVLTTFTIMLGPDCKQHQDGAGCLLPKLVLEAGAG